MGTAKGWTEERRGQREKGNWIATVGGNYVALLASVKAYFLLLIAIYSFRQNDWWWLSWLAGTKYIAMKFAQGRKRKAKRRQCRCPRPRWFPHAFLSLNISLSLYLHFYFVWLLNEQANTHPLCWPTWVCWQQSIVVASVVGFCGWLYESLLHLSDTNNSASLVGWVTCCLACLLACVGALS